MRDTLHYIYQGGIMKKKSISLTVLSVAKIFFAMLTFLAVGCGNPVGEDSENSEYKDAENVIDSAKFIIQKKGKAGDLCYVDSDCSTGLRCWNLREMTGMCDNAKGSTPKYDNAEKNKLGEQLVLYGDTIAVMLPDCFQSPYELWFEEDGLYCPTFYDNKYDRFWHYMEAVEKNSQTSNLDPSEYPNGIIIIDGSQNINVISSWKTLRFRIFGSGKNPGWLGTPVKNGDVIILQTHFDFGNSEGFVISKNDTLAVDLAYPFPGTFFTSPNDDKTNLQIFFNYKNAPKFFKNNSGKKVLRYGNEFKLRSLFKNKYLETTTDVNSPIKLLSSSPAEFPNTNMFKFKKLN